MIPCHNFGKGNISVLKTLQAENCQGLFDVIGEEGAAHADRTAVGWPFFSSVGTDRHKYLLVHGLGTEVLPPPPSPTTLQEWYHFLQGNDTNQNRGVPNDLIGMHYAIWAIFKMAAFEKDENNKRSIYDCYWSSFCIIIVLSRFRELYKSE